MPSFGEFETVGEPLVVSEESSFVSTIWKAQRGSEGDKRQYAVKCFLPRTPGKPLRGASETHLEADPRLNFREGVLELQKAAVQNPRFLTPVYTTGIAPEGAFYVTDFYARNNLKAWIERLGTVDDAALQQIVASSVAGCLALKRSRGYSHGNLKPSNIFLVGQSRPLRSTVFHLADCFPAAPLQLATLMPADRKEVGELLRAVIETRDLRAIGELVLQLVEGRLFSRSEDYNYPVESGPAWQALGKKADFWRDLCNELLNPSLSLETIDLEKMAARFPAAAASNGKLLVIAGTAVAVVLVGAGVFYGLQSAGKKREARRQEQIKAALAQVQTTISQRDPLLANNQLQEAQKLGAKDGDLAELRTRINGLLQARYGEATNASVKALQSSNFTEATNQAVVALKYRPGDKPAEDLFAAGKRAIEQAQNQKLQAAYQAALKAAQEAQAAGDYTKAIAQADEALKNRPGDAVAQKLKTDAQNAQLAARSAAQKEEAYQAAVKAAQGALAAEDYARAIAQTEEALRNKPGDATAQKLRNDAQTAQQQANALAKAEQDYQAALKAGQDALTARDFTKAIAQADAALKLKPGDTAAQKLRSDAQTAQQQTAALAKVEQDYQAALKAGQDALTARDFTKAIAQADAALKLKPGDTAAQKLRSDAQTTQQQAANLAKLEQDYQAALKAGREALGARNFEQAIAQADAALKLKSRDPAAEKLKTEAQTAQQQATALAKAEQDYQAALKGGREALGTRNFDQAIAQADAALKLKPGDAAAQKLRTDAQTAQQQAANLAKLEQDYQAALKASQEALSADDYSKAVAQADAALKLKPGDAAAQNLKTAAQQKAAAVAKLDQDYQAALKAGREALGAKNYDQAVAQADVALKLKPSDSAAQNLKTEAQQLAAAAAKVEKDYQAALKSGRDALGAKNYEQAATKAEEALKLKPGDTSAQNLKSEAQQLATAAARLEQNYQTVLKDGQAALSGKDHSRALSQAAEALKLKPGDTAAEKLRSDALQLKRTSDYQVAQASFKQGDYAKAAELSSQYQQDAEFKTLGEQVRKEQGLFTSAQKKLADGDYTLLDELKKENCDQKANFAALVADANKENDQLTRLKGFVASTNWTDASALLSSLGNAPYLGKPPFQALKQRIEQMDPKKWLLNDLRILQALFDKLDKNEEILDPKTGRPMKVTALPKTASLPRYEKALDDLKGKLSEKNMLREPDVKRRIDLIEAAMKLWN
jgi:hypothetical protein